MLKSELLKLFSQKIQQTNWQVNTAQQEKLIDYLLLLDKWNKVHNLSGIKNLEASLHLNILDSLSLLNTLSKQQEIVLDVGSGAGLPGIPLAIVLEENQFILVDAKQKKVNFLQHVITSLELSNVTAISSRLETYKSDLNFTLVCSRAFAKVEKFIDLSGRFCTSPEARIIAMQADQDKYHDLLLPAGFFVDKLEVIHLPGVEVKRCLVTVKRGEKR